MPRREAEAFPPLLSQTGAFADVRQLKPRDGLIHYDLNVAFWSDGASKERWISVPSGARIEFSSTGEWTFPAGTVLVKHFELATDETRPDQRRRLETRLLMRDEAGGVFGATYKWRADNSDADLLAEGATERIPVRTAAGMRTQVWFYPSRQDCLTCHTALSGGVLGLKTRQLNRSVTDSSGIVENQLRVWNRLGLFQPKLDDAAPERLPRLARLDDSHASIEERARSYLDANCSQCHRPGGTVATFDARFDVPLPKQNLIGGRVLIDQGVDGARNIAPNDVWRSIVLMRAGRLDGVRMPPLPHGELDRRGLALLREWIESLPGPPVLPPPMISPSGGDSKPVIVALSAAPGASIRYTLDGSVPTATDASYERPIRIVGPTVVRARAFKAGFTKSITAQQIFNVDE